jgi:riboflavin biosynthesis pyrimidine reductase
MPAKTRSALEKQALVFLQPAPELQLLPMLETLYTEHHIQHLVCEGGPSLLRSLLASDLVDVLRLTLCPKIFGGASAPTLSGVADAFFSESRPWHLDSLEEVGEECFVRYSRTKR